MSKDKCIKLSWSVAEKVMRTVKSLAESPVKKYWGKSSEILGGKFIYMWVPKAPKTFNNLFAKIFVDGNFNLKNLK